jgi:phage shock protein A
LVGWGRGRVRDAGPDWSRRKAAQEMANPFVKAWKYLMASFSSKIDEYADPKVQIQQAVEEAQRQHQALSQQAAAVIGNQRQLEVKLSRQLGEIEKLQSSARQALVLADDARGRGDQAKAQQYEQAAESFATQLVTTEQSVEDLKTLHDQSLQAATQAKQAVERNAMVLQQKIAERTKLLSQLEQAKMQEQVSASLRSMSELAAPGNTPSLDEVRDKIERRYANALGAAELAQNSVQGRMLEVQQSTLDMAGRSRLEQIRASIRGAPIAGEVTAGEPASPPASPQQAIPPRGQPQPGQG